LPDKLQEALRELEELPMLFAKTAILVTVFAVVLVLFYGFSMRTF